MSEAKRDEGLRRSPEDDPPPRCHKHPDRYLFVEDCGWCGGDGTTQPGELYEDDPLWYDQDDVETCHSCRGRGWFYECQACFDGVPASNASAPEAPPKDPAETPE